MSKQILVAKRRSGVLIDDIALKILEDFQPQVLEKPHPVEAQRFLECKLESLTKISYDYRKLQSGIHGFTDIEEMECVICSTLVDKESQSRFLRSTIAHELGHCFMHVPEFRNRKLIAQFIHNKDGGLVLKREDNIPLYANPEWQAFRFGGAFLIPKASLEIAIRETKNINELCEIFDVHPAFLRSRLKALKMSL